MLNKPQENTCHENVDIVPKETLYIKIRRSQLNPGAKPFVAQQRPLFKPRSLLNPRAKPFFSQQRSHLNPNAEPFVCSGGRDATTDWAQLQSQTSSSGGNDSTIGWAQQQLQNSSSRGDNSTSGWAQQQPQQFPSGGRDSPLGWAQQQPQQLSSGGYDSTSGWAQQQPQQFPSGGHDSPLGWAQQQPQQLSSGGYDSTSGWAQQQPNKSSSSGHGSVKKQRRKLVIKQLKGADRFERQNVRRNMGRLPKQKCNPYPIPSKAAKPYPVYDPMDIDQDNVIKLDEVFRWVEWRTIANETKQRKAIKMRMMLEKEVRAEIKANEEIAEYERYEKVRRGKWREKARPPDPITAGKKRVRDEYSIHVAVPEVEERQPKKKKKCDQHKRKCCYS
jgi:hypothetical protein